MAINFIPNDPFVQGQLPMRQISPHVGRPFGRAQLKFLEQYPEQLFQVDEPGFTFWQCREAVLRTIEVWEKISGSLDSWQNGRPLEIDVSDDAAHLNSYYVRRSLLFGFENVSGRTVRVAHSTEAAAHETGHALLDTIRPEFWNQGTTEFAAFNESFADCIALLTSLFDRETRQSIIPMLQDQNALETLCEEVGESEKILHPGSSGPRHALNKFKYFVPGFARTHPQNEPTVEDGNAHSFSQIFTGCFYDLIRNIFARLNGGGEADLLAAATIAGTLLVDATKHAALQERFFREVGRTMMAIDVHANNGVNQDAIRRAFTAHDIPLASSTFLDAETVLAGSPPRFGARALIDGATRRDVLERFNADNGAALSLNALTLSGRNLVRANYIISFPLSDIHKKFKNVVGTLTQQVTIGDERGRAAALCAIPNAANLRAEAALFVCSLLERNAIDFQVRTRTPKKVSKNVTHIVKIIRDKPTLTRVRFACACWSGLSKY